MPSDATYRLTGSWRPNDGAVLRNVLVRPYPMTLPTTASWRISANQRPVSNPSGQGTLSVRTDGPRLSLAEAGETVATTGRYRSSSEPVKFADIFVESTTVGRIQMICATM